MSTQRTLETHMLLKSLAPQAPQWPQHLATGPSLALATALASSLLATCKQHRVLYQLRQLSTASKRLIFYPSTLPPRRGFCSHRRAHMRAYSLHRCAYMHACTPNRRTSMRTCSLHRCTLKCACSPYRCAPVHACQTYRGTLMRACSTHRRALNFPFCTPMCIHLVYRCARMRAFHRIARACGPTPHQKPPKYPCTALHTNPSQKLKTYFYAG
jgi:hypothetical protein